FSRPSPSPHRRQPKLLAALSKVLKVDGESGALFGRGLLEALAAAVVAILGAARRAIAAVGTGAESCIRTAGRPPLAAHRFHPLDLLVEERGSRFLGKREVTVDALAHRVGLALEQGPALLRLQLPDLLVEFLEEFTALIRRQLAIILAAELLP